MRSIIIIIMTEFEATCIYLWYINDAVSSADYVVSVSGT
jgi:hypothetical protein